MQGKLLSAEVAALPAGSCVLELGSYIGYSAVRIAQALKAGSRLVSLEVDARRAQLARRTITHAGLRSTVTVLVGTAQAEHLQSALRAGACGHGNTSYSLIFLDHKKDLYLPDLKFLEDHGFIRAGTVVVADNVLYPGAPDFRDYVHEVGHYKTMEHKTFLEYQTEKRDVVTISRAIRNPGDKGWW